MGWAEQYLGPARILNNSPKLRPSPTRAISTWSETSPPIVGYAQAWVSYILQRKGKIYIYRICTSLG